MAPAPHNEETVCSDGTSWAGHGHGHTDFRKRWHKAVCQINVYSVKMTTKPGPQQSPLSEVDFMRHLVKGFVEPG